MLRFSPGKRCPCPCSDAVLRSCEEALAGIILDRPPSLWFAWVGSGCAGALGAGAARGPGAGGRGGGGGGGQGPVSINVHTCMYLQMNESLFEQHGGPVLAKNCEIKILK